MKPAYTAHRRDAVRADRGALVARAVVLVGLAASFGLLIAGDGDAPGAGAPDATLALSVPCTSEPGAPSAAL